MANADGSLGVVQQAFQDHHGLQCGFCTPGNGDECAARLLKGHPHGRPRPRIRDYLEGNLCRCNRLSQHRQGDHGGLGSGRQRGLRPPNEGGSSPPPCWFWAPTSASANGLQPSPIWAFVHPL